MRWPAIGEHYRMTSDAPWHAEDGSRGTQHFELEVEVVSHQPSGAQWELVRCHEETGRPPHDWARGAPHKGGVAWFAVRDHFLPLPEEWTNPPLPRQQFG